MALPDWMRVSVDSIALARRLRSSGRQDLIDAVERGDMTLEAAVEQAEGNTSPDKPSSGKTP